MGTPKRILFILKAGQNGNYGAYHRKYSGLYNSTKFVSDAIGSHPNIVSHVVIAIDGNCVDRLVHEFKPDKVVFEALWIPPSKIPILRKLHPKVKSWSVHLHSDPAFIALEGCAVQHLKELTAEGVEVITNSTEMEKAIKYAIAPKARVLVLTNCYPRRRREHRGDKETLDIAAFGAFRVLKNQFTEAVCAIKLAKRLNKPLKFHVNSGRVEGGASILKNVRELFKGTENELVEHEWHSHESFLKILQKMDLVMQVSFSETFCIIAADAISVGTPCIGSNEVYWLSVFSKADPNDIDDIVRVSEVNLHSRLILKENQIRLALHSYSAKRRWIRWALS